MVHAVRAFFILLLLAGVRAFAFVDLTPTPGVKEVDGVRIPVLYFKIDGRTAIYQPPRGWSYTGSADSLHVYCSGEKPGDATVEKIPLPKPVAFDEAQMSLSAQTASQSLPKGSENLKLVSQEKNSLRIGNKETLETIVSYSFFGHAMQASILDVNLGTMILRFKLISEKKDFQVVHRQFRGSLFSWIGL